MWHVLKVQSPKNIRTELREIHAEVLEWVAANKTKTVSVKVVCAGKSHVLDDIPENTLLAPSIVVKFRAKRDAVLFKMMFDHYKFVEDYPKVLISLVRRVMPSIIAQDIIGVSPMTGPTGLIFALRSRYGRKNRHAHLKKRHERRAAKAS